MAHSRFGSRRLDSSNFGTGELLALTLKLRSKPSVDAEGFNMKKGRKVKSIPIAADVHRDAQSEREMELRVTTLGIGHGDAILLEYFGGHEIWRCLVDGGEDPAALRRALQEYDSTINQIDLLVVSHIDNDHVGGLFGFTSSFGGSHVHVAEFWGPALPAFERHLWAFGSKCQESIDRARRLEDDLVSSNTGMTRFYPLEGFVAMPTKDRRLKITVLFPPAKLIRGMLVSDNILDVLSQEPTPQAYLLNDDDDEDVELPASLARLDSELSRCHLTPDSFPDDLTVASSPPSKVGFRATHEFFGDSLLNNTSITLYVEVILPNTSVRTVLLPGDLENWAYLFHRHPRGLRADVLKASHHGGRVYCEGKEAENELMHAVQPRALLISASGRHDLPRASTRLAAARRGAAVFCTSCRSKEFILSAESDEKSCHSEKYYNCTSETESRTLVITATDIFSDSLACHSGFQNDPGPVVQLQQHIVVPSGVTKKLLEREMTKHIGWIRRHLLGSHRQHLNTDDVSIPVRMTTSDDIRQAALKPPARHDLAYNLPTVFEEGVRRGQFWARSSSSGYHNHFGRYEANWELYALPSPGEAHSLVDWVTSRSCLIFESDDVVKFSDSDGAIAQLMKNCEFLKEAVEECLCFPRDLFPEAISPVIAAGFSTGWNWFGYRNALVLLSRGRKAPAVADAIVAAWLGGNTSGSTLMRRGMLPSNRVVFCSRSRRETTDRALFGTLFAVEKSRLSDGRRDQIRVAIEDEVEAARKNLEAERQSMRDKCKKQLGIESNDTAAKIVVIGHLGLLERTSDAGSQAAGYREGFLRLINELDDSTVQLLLRPAVAPRDDWNFQQCSSSPVWTEEFERVISGCVELVTLFDETIRLERWAENWEKLDDIEFFQRHGLLDLLRDDIDENLWELSLPD